MKTNEFLDFSDILSHENELLEFNNFDFIEVISNESIAGAVDVYDLVVDKNRNYVTENLGIVHNGGKRSGAGTVALPIWHNDIFDFLDMQTEHGDARLKSYDVFPQVTVPSLFMQRDKENGTWTTFCPYEVRTKLGIDIRGLYGEAFNTEYLKIEAAFLAGKLKVAKTYKARDIIKTMMRTQFETGLPYIAFTDTMNAVNPNAYHRDSIGITNVNLCVTGDTIIEINAGDSVDTTTVRLDSFVNYFGENSDHKVQVKTYDDKSKSVKFSEITNAVLTKYVTELIEIEDSSGKIVKCTPDHKIFTQNRGWVEAQNLIETDELMIG